MKEELFKKVADDFIYWWNEKGTNTDQTFDDWWKINKDKYQSAESPLDKFISEITEEDIKKLMGEDLPEKIKDIINCIIKFDDKESLESKGAYFEVIQRDLKAAMQDLPEKTAEEILEEGINDGTYACILDVINVDTNTHFFKSVVQFAKDYASQFQSKPQSFQLTDEEISKQMYEMRGNLLKGKGNMSIHRMTLSEVEWMCLCLDLAKWYRDQVQINTETILKDFQQWHNSEGCIEIDDVTIEEYLNLKNKQ